MKTRYLIILIIVLFQISAIGLFPQTSAIDIEASLSVSLQSNVLDSTDFIVSNISTNINIKTLTIRFGKPDSISRVENPFDSASKINTWYYKDVVFTFIDDSSCLGFSIVSKRFSTKRGLTIGDPVTKIIRLYGEKSYPYHEDYEYLDPNDEFHIIRVILSKGKVKEIYLGYLLD